MKKIANRILAFAMAMTLLFGGTLGIEQVSASVANTDDYGIKQVIIDGDMEKWN